MGYVATFDFIPLLGTSAKAGVMSLPLISSPHWGPPPPTCQSRMADLADIYPYF